MKGKVTRRFFIGCASSFGVCNGLRAFAAPTGVWSRGEPNLRFGLLSDLHIKCQKGSHGCAGGPELFEKALCWFRDKGVDAVVIAGDMSDFGLGDELMLVAKTWYKVFPNDRAGNGRKVERVFITGNHESCVFSGNGNLRWIRRLYGNDDVAVRRQLLRNDFAGWWEKAFHEKYERFYHRNIKGYDFLSAHWDDGSPLPDRPLDDFGWIKGKIHVGRETFGVELEEWLKRNAGMMDPRRPFFYQQHRALYNTNYGSWAWNHDAGRATKVLSGYPNAVAFAGDTHYSLTDERSIWQGAFTSVGTGSMRYTGLPYDSRPPRGYENSGGGDKVMDSYDAFNTAQGQLVSVYDDRIVFERRDFACDMGIGDDWVVPTPLSESRPYAFAERARKAGAPEFPDGARLKVEGVFRKNRAKPAEEKKCLRVTIPATLRTVSGRCMEYEVTFIGSGGERRVFYALAEGFNKPIEHPRVASPTEFCIAVDKLPTAVDQVEVRPLDCWWNKGRQIVTRVRPEDVQV